MHLKQDQLNQIKRWPAILNQSKTVAFFMEKVWKSMKNRGIFTKTFDNIQMQNCWAKFISISQRLSDDNYWICLYDLAAMDRLMKKCELLNELCHIKNFKTIFVWIVFTFISCKNTETCGHIQLISFGQQMGLTCQDRYRQHYLTVDNIPYTICRINCSINYMVIIPIN